MDDGARACKVGKGTLYRYFQSKRDLYLAVTFDGIGRLRGELRAALGQAPTPARRIEAVVRCTLGFFWDRRRFFALIHQHEQKPDADAQEWFRQRRDLTQLVEHALEQTITAGHMRRVDTRIATEMLFGMMRGVNRYRTREDTLDALVASIVDIFMRGVGTPIGQRNLRRHRMRNI